MSFLNFDNGERLQWILIRKHCQPWLESNRSFYLDLHEIVCWPVFEQYDVCIHVWWLSVDHWPVCEYVCQSVRIHIWLPPAFHDLLTFIWRWALESRHWYLTLTYILWSVDLHLRMTIKDDHWCSSFTYISFASNCHLRQTTIFDLDIPHVVCWPNSCVHT